MRQPLSQTKQYYTNTIHKESKNETKIKQLIELLTQESMMRKSHGSFYSRDTMINLDKSGTKCIVGNPASKMAIDFLNYLIESTPSLELHQMTFTKLPEIKGLNAIKFNILFLAILVYYHFDFINSKLNN